MKIENKNQKGFTLIELVVVIAILAILAGVAIPKFLTITTEARKAAFSADVGTLKAGVSTFAAQQAAKTGKLTYPTKAQLGEPSATGADAGLEVLGGVLETSAAQDFKSRGWSYDATAGKGTIGSGSFTYNESNGTFVVTAPTE